MQPFVAGPVAMTAATPGSWHPFGFMTRRQAKTLTGLCIKTVTTKGVINMELLIIALANAKFPLGQIVMTANASGQLAAEDMQKALTRHASGDWGDVCEEDREENELSLKEGFRLLSVYRSGESKFWIITEADRSITTVLMPEDY